MQSGNYQKNVDVGNVTTYILNGLTLGLTYYIAATAYNTQGLESGFSNEVVYTASSCTYSITPSSLSISASGGTGSVAVTTQAGCTWGTSAAPSWVTINSGSGTGNGTMSYTVSPNTGTARMASMTIAGNVFTINEAGAPSSSTVIKTPVVTTGSATSVTLNSATLNGNITPNGLSTTYVFQWGRTTTYGYSTAVSSTSGTGSVAASARITGLRSYTSYHYRLVATNSAGTSYGGDQSFITNNSQTSSTTYSGQIDFNNDGKPDLLWRNKTTGNVGVWYMNGVTTIGTANYCMQLQTLTGILSVQGISIMTGRRIYSGVTRRPVTFLSGI